MTDQEQSLYNQALAIRDEQQRGVPLAWIKAYPLWLQDLRTYELTQQQPAPAPAVEQMELM